jgi:DNA-binding XRE family transcriptional regulator
MGAKRFTGQEVREVRESYGLTQQDLAAQLEVSIGTIQAFEAGRVGERSRIHKLVESWLAQNKRGTRHAADASKEESGLAKTAEILHDLADFLADESVNIEHRLDRAGTDLGHIARTVAQLTTRVKKP